MNGRIYSPKLGRMLSPDPVTQAPENGQNYNRYSYGYNNPLKYTDPSGFVSCSTSQDGEGGYCVPQGSDNSGGYTFSIDLSFAFGWAGGNGCDRTCKMRHAALDWCRIQAACFEAVQGVREKIRMRAAMEIQLAEIDGTEWVVADNGKGTSVACTISIALEVTGKFLSIW